MSLLSHLIVTPPHLLLGQPQLLLEPGRAAVLGPLLVGGDHQLQRRHLLAALLELRLGLLDRLHQPPLLLEEVLLGAGLGAEAGHGEPPRQAARLGLLLPELLGLGEGDVAGRQVS